MAAVWPVCSLETADNLEDGYIPCPGNVTINKISIVLGTSQKQKSPTESPQLAVRARSVAHSVGWRIAVGVLRES